MAEVINLRSARKARARKDAEAQASANRARFGRTKGEKARDRLESERAERLLDGARREEP